MLPQFTIVEVTVGCTYTCMVSFKDHHLVVVWEWGSPSHPWGTWPGAEYPWEQPKDSSCPSHDSHM